MYRSFLTITCLLFFLGAAAQYRIIRDSAYKIHSDKAITYYYQKDYANCVLHYDSAFAATKGVATGEDRYNAACAWALLGNKDKALLHLQKAIKEEKWSAYEHTAHDSDLLVVHNDARWPGLLQQIRENEHIKKSKQLQPLVAQLDTIYKSDQGYRYRITELQKQYGPQSEVVQKLWDTIARQDSINLKLVTHIVDTYGWLGPEKVGGQGNLTIFLVIQHADLATQKKYIPLLRKAVARGEARSENLALMEDRILVGDNKPQLYGSQLRWDAASNGYTFYPIENEKEVNKRRAAMGLNSIEEYAQRFNVKYEYKE